MLTTWKHPRHIVTGLGIGLLLSTSPTLAQTGALPPTPQQKAEAEKIAAGASLPLTDPVPDLTPPGETPDADPPAVVDVTPYPHVEIGLKTQLTDDGLIVSSVKPETPASRAELQASDVIKRAGERTVLTEKDLDETFHRYPASGRVPLDVLRDGKKVELTLILPSDHEPHLPPPPWGTKPVDPSELKGTAIIDEKDVVRDEAIGWVLSERGTHLVEVVSITPETAAARAGLISNDLILSVDGQKYTDPAQVSVAVHQHNAGEVAILGVRRGSQEGIVPLTIPGPIQPTLNRVGGVQATTGIIPSATGGAVPITGTYNIGPPVIGQNVLQGTGIGQTLPNGAPAAGATNTTPLNNNGQPNASSGGQPPATTVTGAANPLAPVFPMLPGGGRIYFPLNDAGAQAPAAQQQVGGNVEGFLRSPNAPSPYPGQLPNDVTPPPAALPPAAGGAAASGS
ncbi:MAG: PDZ domain-containing protein [Planctomycetaceae bacterium]|nr:PDZ domain-containing protein [Planctomycetaceae bacterium]